MFQTKSWACIENWVGFRFQITFCVIIDRMLNTHTHTQQPPAEREIVPAIMIHTAELEHVKK